MSQPKRLPKLVDAEPEIRIAKATPRARHLLKKYGITIDQYEELYSKQKGCCYVCGKHSSAFNKRFAIDHDHVSGEIRGLLCFRCNKFAVGRYRKGDGTDLLRRIIEYLERDYSGWIVPPKVKRKRRARRKRIR